MTSLSNSLLRYSNLMNVILNVLKSFLFITTLVRNDVMFWKWDWSESLLLFNSLQGRTLSVQFRTILHNSLTAMFRVNAYLFHGCFPICNIFQQLYVFIWSYLNLHVFLPVLCNYILCPNIYTVVLLIALPVYDTDVDYGNIFMPYLLSIHVH